MTTAAPREIAAALAPPRASAGRGSELGAGVVEFLLVGGGTLLLFPIGWVLRGVLGLESAEYAVGFFTFYAAYVVNDPHFTVTYVLFYKDARRRTFDAQIPAVQRARYVVAGVVAPLALALWAGVAVATRSAATLGWMVELMFLLVGWHYVKQGFGVLTVLSLRRGVPLTARERAVFLFHCFAGWAYAWASPAAPAGLFEEKGVVYRGLSHPAWLELVTGVIFAASAGALVFVLAQKWHRERRMIPLAPLSGFLITVWLWTIWSSADPLMRYLIPALHSVQYFYFVWLLKRNQARAEEGPPAFGKPVAVRLGVLALSALALGWLLFRGVPTFLDEAFVPKGVRSGRLEGPLGATPFFAAFYVVVNLHHYFMDYVIWRRENPDTRWLSAR